MRLLGGSLEGVPGDLREHASASLSDPWILILVGVSAHGHRRAARVCAEALDSGADSVVWFDGYPGKDIPGAGRSEDRLAFIDYTPDLRNGWPSRMIESPQTGRGRFATITRIKVLRRIAALIQPYTIWRLLRASIQSLQAGTKPRQIVCCDETAMSAAWHAARLWPDTEVICSGPQS